MGVHPGCGRPVHGFRKGLLSFGNAVGTQGDRQFTLKSSAKDAPSGRQRVLEEKLILVPRKVSDLSLKAPLPPIGKMTLLLRLMSSTEHISARISLTLEVVLMTKIRPPTILCI